MFEKFTAYEPMQTTTTTWAGWRIMNPKCYGCIHCAVRGDIASCRCVSRTMKVDGTCLSYFGRDAR